MLREGVVTDGWGEGGCTELYLKKLIGAAEDSVLGQQGMSSDVKSEVCRIRGNS
jgi:hypothetical protein